MVRHAVKKNRTASVKPGWHTALRDAEAKLAAAKSQVKSLEVTVQTCRDRIRNNDPWPEDSMAK